MNQNRPAGSLKAHFILLLICTWAPVQVPAMSCIFSPVSSSFNSGPDEEIRRGDSLLNHGHPDQALQYFIRATRLYEKTGDQTGLIRSGTGLAGVYFQRSDWESALRVLRRAANRCGTIPEQKDSLCIKTFYLLARTYNESGLNGKPGYFDSARLYYEKALDLRLNTKTPEPGSLAENYYRLGSLLYYDLPDYDRSEENLLKAWEIYKREADSLDINFGRTNYILASLNRSKGDLSRAISYATEANRIFSHPKVNRQLYALYAQIVLANTYYDENRYRQAIGWYEIVIKKAIEYFGPANPFLINFYNNYAAALIAMKQPAAARKQLKRALTINMENPPVDFKNLSFSYLHLADCAEQEQKPDSALYFLNRSLSVREKYLPGSRSLIYQGTRYIGEFYERRDSLDLALQYYQKALQVLFPEFNPDDIDANPDFSQGNREDIFYILYDKARTLLKRYYRKGDSRDLQNAYTLYLTGDRLVDEARNSSFLEESKLLVFELLKKDRDAGILCAYELYKQTVDQKYLEGLFMLTEKNKSMLLLQTLMNVERKSTLGIPDSIKTRQDDLNRRISVLRHQLNALTPDSTNAGIIARWNHQLLTATAARDELQKALAHAYPDYYNMKYTSNLISLREVQRRLRTSGQQALDYYWGDTLAFVLSIFPDTVFVKKIRLDKNLFTALKSFALNLTGKGRGDEPLRDFKNYVSSAHLLYRKLVEPGLNNKGTKRRYRLIIIPDGPLAQLPFEAFLTSPAQTGFIDYSKLPYLVFNETISYAYSLNLLFQPRTARKTPPEHQLLAMSYSGPQTSITVHERKGVPQELPWSEKELKAIKETLKSGIYLSGIKATETRFKELAPRSMIVHLAVHGTADQNNALNSKLEFKSTADNANDGELFNYELYDMDLQNTRLAVLSACETGVGRQYAGEGVFSIARAFYYAGCPAIVMSLWKVHDKYTSLLMKGFYENLSHHKRIDAALHEAKCSFLHKAGEMEGHPANWASFIVIGKTPKLYPAGHTSIYILAAILLMTGLGFFYFKQRKR